MRTCALCLAAFLAAGCSGRNGTETDAEPWGDDIWQVRPTPDPNASGGVRIPTDLEDAFRELDRMLHPGLKARMKGGNQNQMIEHHFGLGRWMRNNWGLWGGSDLARFFFRRGIMHPDDMSGFILAQYWNRLHGQPITLPPPLPDDQWQPIWRRMHEE